jgi:2-iminoacetate synthase
MTLKEYLVDYASGQTREAGGRLIEKELQNIPREKIREAVCKNLVNIENGQRDFRF